MTLANPWALLWLAISLPVAALFFFRVRPTEIVVPALALWEQLNRAREYHGFGRRFGRWPTLLAQLVIVALLALILGEPRLAADRRDTVIVLDDSATMQTVDESGRTRFDLARDLVLERVRDAGVAAVILAGEPIRVAARRDADGAAMRSIVAGLAPRDVNADLSRAIRLASNVAADARAGRVLMISDKRPPLAESRIPLDWSRIGKPQPNIGIAAVRKSHDGRELIVTIHQTEMTGRPAALRLLADDQEIDRKELSLSAPSVEVSLKPPMENNKTIKIQLEPPDALPLDNVAFGVWSAPKPAHVLLVTTGNLPLQAALTQPGLTIETISPDNWHGDDSADVVVLDRPSAPLNARPDGRYLVVGGLDAFGFCPPITSQPDQRPLQWAPDHPALRDVDLFHWKIRMTRGMATCDAAAAIVSAANSPLVLELRNPPASASGSAQTPAAILVNFDLNDSNVPSLAGFPIFIWNAVQYLLGRGVDPTEVAFSTGRPAGIPTDSTEHVRVVDPRGESAASVSETGSVLILQPERAGLYRVETADAATPVAFNWVPTEGSSGDATGSIAASVGASRTASWLQPLWSRVLILAVGLILVELILFHLNILRLG